MKTFYAFFSLVLICSSSLADIRILFKDGEKIISRVEAVYVYGSESGPVKNDRLSGLHISGKDKNFNAVEILVTPNLARQSGIDLLTLAKEVIDNKMFISFTSESNRSDKSAKAATMLVAVRIDD